MESSSVSVSVNVLVEVLRSIEKKLDSQQQVLSAVIQQQQHLHQQQLLLQRHSSAHNLQVSEVHAAPSDITATPAATTAQPAIPVVAGLPISPAGIGRHSPAPAGSSGHVRGSCSGAAAVTPAASLLRTHRDAEAEPASDSHPQCPAADTASSKQHDQEQLGHTVPQAQGRQPKAASSPPNPLPGQPQVQAPVSPALAEQDRLQPMHADSSCAAGPAAPSPCCKQQLAGQPPSPEAAAQLQVQQPKRQESNTASNAAIGTAGKLLAGHCPPLLAEQQQQQRPSASEAAQLPAPQQHSTVEQQRQQLPEGHSALCTGSPLEPTPELLIIPGEGSGSTGTTIYNVDDKQLLCRTASKQECGEAPEQQQQPQEVATRSPSHAGAPHPPAAAALTGDAAVVEVAGAHQGDSVAPEVAGGPSLRKCLSGHARATQLCRYKPSAFIDQQQQMLQSCSGETAEALLSIVSCGKKGSNATSSTRSAAAAKYTQSQKQHAGATSPSDLLSASSTGGALGAAKSAVLHSLYVGKPDLERFASTESINTLGSHQLQKYVTAKQEAEPAAPSAAHLQHPESFSNIGMGLDLQHSMNSPTPLPVQQAVHSPAALTCSQHSPVQSAPLHPMSGTGERKRSASTPVHAAAADGAAAAALNLPPAAALGSQGWQAMCAGQLPPLQATAGLTGACSLPMPTLMPQASSALANAWSVPAPSLAAQSSESFTGWSASFLCAGADLAAVQPPVLLQQHSGSFTQQQRQQMSVEAWQQQQQLASPLQNMPSGCLLPATGGHPSHPQPGRMQHTSASAYGQQQQPGQCAQGAGNRNTTAKVAAAAAAAHAAAKVAAAAAAAQHAGTGAGSKRKHTGNASQASKSQRGSGQVPAQKQRNNSVTSVRSGAPQAGQRLSRSLSASALPQAQQHIAADPAAASSLTQFPSWLLQQAYNTFMPMSCSNSTAAAAAQQQQKVTTTVRNKGAVSAAPTATVAPTSSGMTPMSAVGPAPAAVQAAVAVPPPAAGSGSTDSFLVDDTAGYFSIDQGTNAAATLPGVNLPPLAPTMEAAAAAAGVSLQTAGAALDNVDAATVAAVAAGGDGLGSTVYIPTGGFMQMLQDPLF